MSILCSEKSCPIRIDLIFSLLIFGKSIFVFLSIFALFNVLIANFGAPTGVIVWIITTLIFGSFVDLNELLPYGILSGPLGNIFEILNNILGVFIGPVIIIGGFVLFWSLFSRTARRRREMRRVYGH